MPTSALRGELLNRVKRLFLLLFQHRGGSGKVLLKAKRKENPASLTITHSHSHQFTWWVHNNSLKEHLLGVSCYNNPLQNFKVMNYIFLIALKLDWAEIMTCRNLRLRGGGKKTDDISRMQFCKIAFLTAKITTLSWKHGEWIKIQWRGKPSVYIEKVQGPKEPPYYFYDMIIIKKPSTLIPPLLSYMDKGFYSGWHPYFGHCGLPVCKRWGLWKILNVESKESLFIYPFEPLQFSKVTIIQSSLSILFFFTFGWNDKSFGISHSNRS